MATYYVNSASGSDANDGSSGSPWLTIQYALDNAIGAEQHTFALIGSFTISTALNFAAYHATVVLAQRFNRFPIFNGQGTATLTLSVANAIGHPTRLANLNVINTLTFFAGASINPSGGQAYLDNCIVTGPQSAWTRVIAVNSDVTNARIAEAYNCILRDTVGNLATPVYDSGRYTRCIITSIVAAGTGYASRYIRADHCSIFLPNLTSRFVSMDEYGREAIITNCVFHVGGGNILFASSGYTPAVFKGNKIFGTTIQSTLIEDWGDNSVLSEAPFSDPTNGDFSPSAELIGLAVDNIVPGAVQPAGGQSRINPFKQQVIG